MASIVPSQEVPSVIRVSEAERQQIIQDVVSNMWQYMPDLSSRRPQTLQVQAQNGLIAYAGPDGHLYLTDPNGTMQIPLITNLDNLKDPAWSPDEEYLAFVGDGENTRCLYKLEISNSDWTELSCGFNTIWVPRWSPDGEYLAFFGKKEASDPVSVWVVPSGGGSATALAPSLITSREPDWIDEDTVVFSGEIEGDIWHVYRVNITQPDQHQAITPNIACVPCACAGGSILATHPVVSPDGSLVAYLGGRTELGKNDCIGYFAVYLVDPAGATAPSKIADVAGSATTGAANVHRMLWAPDNQTVGLIASGSDNVLRLATVNVDSGNVTTLHGREGGT